jgi:hypothetical protein
MKQNTKYKTEYVLCFYISLFTQPTSRSIHAASAEQFETSHYMTLQDFLYSTILPQQFGLLHRKRNKFL